MRALAVIPVLLFHAFPQLVPGGFFGVDIFFVISGYLISGIIFRGLIGNSFSYADFYAKRIRRILPNLITLLIFVASIGWFTLSADEFSALGKHIYSSAGFYQNFRLLSESGYFDVSAIEKPLLHLWSLAVEEQFYIIFPVLCVVVWRFSNNFVVVGILILTITLLSLVSCLSVADNTFNFYFPFTRFWEIGVGILLAYFEIFYKFDGKKLAKGVRSGISTIGFVVILASILLYKETIKSPGLFNILPVIGAGLLIFANNDAFINRTILSWKVVLFVGLISYSLYLWHWPLISYLHIVFPQASKYLYLIALLLSFPVSIFVYYFIETPLRISKKKCLIFSLPFALLFCVFMGQTIKWHNGFENRSINLVMKLIPNKTYEFYTEQSNLLEVPVRVIDKSTFPEVLFVGDSHIRQYASRVKMLSEKTGKNAAFFTESGCFVSIGLGSLEECKKTPQALKTLLQDNRIKTVVIGQMWGYYKQRHPERFEKGMQQYRDLIKQYGKEKDFFVLLDAPWDSGTYNIKNHLTRMNYKSFKEGYYVEYPKETSWKEGNDFVELFLKNCAHIVKVEQFVCPEMKCNLRNYRDDDHLHSSYVERNAFWIDQVFE